MARRVKELQRDFALCSGERSEIIWDSFSPDQSDILKLKIETLIPENGQKEQAIESMRKTLFDTVWAQRKYTNRTLLSAIIYVMVTNESDAGEALESTSYTCHPVFRTRKCINANNSAGCCMIFIDEHGRVYSNWRQYVENNALPKGTMIAPANGIYTFDENDEVQLEVHRTPMTGASSQILNATDSIFGIGSLVATVPVAATLVMPLAAPIVITATAVTITTAAYSTVRSALRLRDRRKHQQSTALSDREARKNWIDVASGVVGLSALGVSKALVSAATAGKQISLATKVAVNGMNVSSFLLSGTGLANSVYDLYVRTSDEEPMGGLDYVQLASSLLVFTHSVNNLRLVSKISTTDRVASVRRELGNQIRKGLIKITRKVGGAQSANNNVDIVRTLNDVPLKDILLNLHGINSFLNSGISASVVNGTAVTALGQTVLNLVTGARIDFDLWLFIEEFGPQFIERVANPNSLIDVLSAMAKYFSETVFHFLLNLAKLFIEESIEGIDAAINTYISTETVLYKILMHCITKYRTFSYEYLESKTSEILNAIESYFNSLIPVGDANSKRQCKECDGFYYLCTV